MMMPALSQADFDAAMATDDAGLGDLQSDEKCTGGTPEGAPAKQTFDQSFKSTSCSDGARRSRLHARKRG